MEASGITEEELGITHGKDGYYYMEAFNDGPLNVLNLLKP